MCPAKTQISLGIRPVWSESWLSAWRKLGYLSYPGWSESSLGAQVSLLVLSDGGSHVHSLCNRMLVLVSYLDSLICWMGNKTKKCNKKYSLILLKKVKITKLEMKESCNRELYFQGKRQHGTNSKPVFCPVVASLLPRYQIALFFLLSGRQLWMTKFYF